jgi:hypothetical protein
LKSGNIFKKQYHDNIFNHHYILDYIYERSTRLTILIANFNIMNTVKFTTNIWFVQSISVELVVVQSFNTSIS